MWVTACLPSVTPSPWPPGGAAWTDWNLAQITSPGNAPTGTGWSFQLESPVLRVASRYNSIAFASYLLIYPWIDLYSSMCNIFQVIDDSLFESPEEFELRLSDSSYNAKIGTLSSATVIIDGPNDGKSLFFFLINFEKLNTGNVKKKCVANY